MKRTFKYIVLAAMTSAILVLSSCSDDKETPGKPGPDPKPDATVVFSSVSEAIYRGDANGNRLGLYTLTLEAPGQKLYLEVTSSLTDSAAPVPDEGVYDFSADNSQGSFNGKSYWVSTVNGADITRRLTSGSFTLTATETGYKLSGKVAGQDEVPLVFLYEGVLKFIDLNGDPADDAIQCLSARGTYYGLYYIPNASNYYIVLFDTVHSNEGDPYSYRICLDFTSVRPSGGKIMPALGTYRPDMDGTFGEGTFLQGLINGANGTLWQVPDGSGGSTRYMVTDGFFTIRTTDNNKYQIFGTLKDAYGREISFNHVGALPFENDAVGTFTSLTQDFALDEAFYVNQKCYDTTSDPDSNYWKIYFYDEQSWTWKGKQGFFVTFDIPLDKQAKSIPAGEYTPAEHVLFAQPGNYVPGYIFAYDTSLATAFGAWLAKGNGENSVVWAPIRGGSLKLVDNGDKTFTATFDVTDDGYIPKHITGSYTGEIPLTSDSQVKVGVNPVVTRRPR